MAACHKRLRATARAIHIVAVLAADVAGRQLDCPPVAYTWSGVAYRVHARTPQPTSLGSTEAPAVQQYLSRCNLVLSGTTLPPGCRVIERRRSPHLVLHTTPVQFGADWCAPLVAGSFSTKVKVFCIDRSCRCRVLGVCRCANPVPPRPIDPLLKGSGVPVNRSVVRPAAGNLTAKLSIPWARGGMAARPPSPMPPPGVTTKAMPTPSLASLLIVFPPFGPPTYQWQHGNPGACHTAPPWTGTPLTSARTFPCRTHFPLLTRPARPLRPQRSALPSGRCDCDLRSGLVSSSRGSLQSVRPVRLCQLCRSRDPITAIVGCRRHHAP